MRYDYLILGGGVAGTIAAETIRLYDKEGSIAIISQEPYPLYSRILLPNYIQGEIPRERIFLRTREWYHEHRVDLSHHRIARVVPEEEKLVGSEGENIYFKKCLIASGGTPKPFSFTEFEEDIVRLQTLDDADRFCRKVSGVRHAVVVGGGFIGIEFIETFLKKGIPLTILLKEDSYWRGLMAPFQSSVIQGLFKKRGATVLCGEEIQDIQGRDGRIEALLTKTGKKIPCDILAVGIGIDREKDMVPTRAWGKRGIRTNEYLETVYPHIWAAGDVAEYYDVIQGGYTSGGSWTNAAKQGKVAASNMIGNRTPFSEVPAYTIQFFDTIITFIGDSRIDTSREVFFQQSDVSSFHSVFFVLEDNRMTGAVLLNAPEKRKDTERLVRERINLEDTKEMLKQWDADLALLHP